MQSYKDKDKLYVMLSSSEAGLQYFFMFITESNQKEKEVHAQGS